MLRHSDFSLRPLAPSDKEMILAWRNADRVRINMYNDRLITPEEHEGWFPQALVDKSARYMIFEWKCGPVGFVSFTGINHEHGRCIWAFYLGETDVPKGSGSAMEYFALTYAFEHLDIRKLSCEVFAFNTGVIKLHEKFGFVHEGRFVKHHLKNGAYEDIVRLAQFRENWEQRKASLKSRCFVPEGAC
ncbi:MAG: GCN5-related N-acetyltransferase [Herminiimonas sp.]|nr:GCN5-related N-acetyltransferase [Herminiimonas sp.]